MATPMSLFELWKDGIRQIQNAGCATGLVFATLKNRVPHRDYMPDLGTDVSGFPLIGARRDVDGLCRALNLLAHERVGKMVDHVTVDEVRKELEGKKALPALVIVAPTTAVLRTSDGLMLTQVTEVVLRGFESGEDTRITPAVKEVFRSLIEGIG